MVCKPTWCWALYLPFSFFNTKNTLHNWFRWQYTLFAASFFPFTTSTPLQSAWTHNVVINYLMHFKGAALECWIWVFWCPFSSTSTNLKCKDVRICHFCIYWTGSWPLFIFISVFRDLSTWFCNIYCRNLHLLSIYCSSIRQPQEGKSFRTRSTMLMLWVRSEW